MIYRPKELAPDQPLPYGHGSEWPYGRDSTARVFPDETGEQGCWGFYDPDWLNDDGTTRGQFRINVASPTGHGGTGGDTQTLTLWARASDWDEILDRVQAAVRFAREEGMRMERSRIAQELLAQ